MKTLVYLLLTQILGSRKVIKVKRVEDFSQEVGFISAIGQDFVVMNRITDDLQVDGFAVFRTSSITQVQTVGIGSPFQKAVEFFSLAPASADRLVLDNWATLLKSASKEWEVINCFFEKKYPEMCYIGLLQGIRGQKLKLRLINPKGILEKEAATFDMQDLTKVELGGRYESVLRAMWRESAHKPSQGKKTR